MRDALRHCMDRFHTIRKPDPVEIVQIAVPILIDGRRRLAVHRRLHGDGHHQGNPGAGMTIYEAVMVWLIFNELVAIAYLRRARA